MTRAAKKPLYLLTVIALYMVSQLILGLDFNSVKEIKKEVESVDNITNPQQEIWRGDDKIILVTEKDIWEYIIPERENKYIQQRESNQFVGIDKEGNILLCKIEHFTISSYGEFSTKFTIEKKEGRKELHFFETIRPIYLSEKKMIAVTAMDFLEKHFYVIDIASGEMKEIEEPKKRKYKLSFPKDIDFKRSYMKNSNRYLIEDLFGNLYLVKTNS
jgi:hypothetical protein